MNNITEIDAIFSLVPNAMFHTDANGLVWHKDNTLPQPTQAELGAELSRLEARYSSKQYQRDRAEEYPPQSDYLDAVVKGDTVAQQAYIDACLAVKLKYPKPV